MGKILIAGASKGIGFAIAKMLLEEGKEVIVSSRSNDLLKEKFSLYNNAIIVPVDFLRISDYKEFIFNIVKTYGALSGFVYCAGFDKLSPLYMNKEQDVESLWRIHAFAPIMLVSALAKKNQCEPGSSIVLISSLAAHEGAIGHSAYAAAKGSIEGFLPSAASELALKGVRLNVIIPGVVNTEMSQGYIKNFDDSQKTLLQESYPLGIGDPDDIANVIRFLLSNDSKWITGQKIFLDGGHMVRKV